MTYYSKDIYYNTHLNIPKHRKEYISKRIEDFIKEYKMKKDPIDCVELLLQMEKHGQVALKVKSTDKLPPKVDSALLHSKNQKTFLALFNKDASNYTLACIIGHIYLNHQDLPDVCKSHLDLEIEELEAREFARKLLNYCCK